MRGECTAATIYKSRGHLHHFNQQFHQFTKDKKLHVHV